jgi:hypothetical protein
VSSRIRGAIRPSNPYCTASVNSLVKAIATYPASFSANVNTTIPRPMRYTANGTTPRLRTQATNHATEA